MSQVVRHPVVVSRGESWLKLRPVVAFNRDDVAPTTRLGERHAHTHDGNRRLTPEPALIEAGLAFGVLRNGSMCMAASMGAGSTRLSRPTDGGSSTNALARCHRSASRQRARSAVVARTSAAPSTDIPRPVCKRSKASKLQSIQSRSTAWSAVTSSRSTPSSASPLFANGPSRGARSVSRRCQTPSFTSSRPDRIAAVNAS
jgi:hypothetical protein